jgi:hypothetical protein
MKRLFLIAFFATAATFAADQNQALVNSIKQSVNNQKPAIKNLLVNIFTSQPEQAREILELLREYLCFYWNAAKLAQKTTRSQSQSAEIQKIVDEITALQEQSELNSLNDEKNLTKKIAELKAAGKEPIVSINLEKALEIQNKINKLSEKYEAAYGIARGKTEKQLPDIVKKSQELENKFFNKLTPLGQQLFLQNSDFWFQLGWEFVDDMLKKLPAKTTPVSKK